MTTQIPADNRQTPEQATPEQTRLFMAFEDAPQDRKEIQAARLAAFVRSCLHPQASPGREWERDVKVKMTCGAWRVTLRTNDVNSIYGLTINGRWLPWSEWCRLPDSETDFPTQAAARAALSQVPDPRELEPSSEVGRWIVDEHGWISSMNMSGPAAMVMHKSWAKMLVNDANLGAALSQAPDPRTPQASTASDKEACACCDDVYNCGTPDGRALKAIRASPPPASEAERADRTFQSASNWKIASEADLDRAASAAIDRMSNGRQEPVESWANRIAIGIVNDVASEAERPKCPDCGGGEHVVRSVVNGMLHCRCGCDFPTPSQPTPADAGSVSVDLRGCVGQCSRGRMGLILGRETLPWGESWVGVSIGDGGQWASRNPKVVMDHHAVCAALSAPSPSPATTARAGFTYPDERVEATINWIHALASILPEDSDSVKRALVCVSALRAARVTLPPTPPATVPVPLELARMIVDRDHPIRQHLERDDLHARLYDTLAAGVEEADRTAKKEMSP